MEHDHMLRRPNESPSRTTEHEQSSTDSVLKPSVDDSQRDMSNNQLDHHDAQQKAPYYHDPAQLRFPDAPSTELPPIQPASAMGQEVGNNTLPSLSSITGSQPFHSLSPQLAHSSHNRQVSSAGTPPWSTLSPRPTFNPRPADSPARMDLDATSVGTIGAASPDYFLDGRASSVSLDDPDVRLAAEALGDLRADFMSSPQSSNTPLPARSRSHSSVSSATYPRPPQPEPLLSLLTTSHPILATTIGGAASAYNTSKNFSPRFKSGAEYVEGYLTPIANTVGSVGRVTGVESSVRWFFGGRRQKFRKADMEAGDASSSKRRKVDRGDATPLSSADTMLPPTPEFKMEYDFTSDRRLSEASTIDCLPAYEDLSPAYKEHPDGTVAKRQSTRNSNAPWGSRLFISTSGLSISMSEESLRSLKYCLTWLRWANEHIGKVISALKIALEQYEQTEQSERSGNDASDDSAMTDTNDTLAARQARRQELAARITALKDDVVKTLRDVVETVSKYAGGSLPENARVLVRRHLTGLPRKFQLAMATSSSPSQQQGQGQGQGQGQSKGQGQQQGEQEQEGGEEEGEQARDRKMKEGAQRALVLAKEGLDMMAQVSGVLDDTIVSAEEWCERLGRKKKQSRDTGSPQAQPILPVTDGDVKMG